MARAGAKRSTRKLKIARSLGVNLWGQAKSPFNKRKYKPGQHGPTSRGGNSSDYAKQMRAKQTLKGYYGNIGEKKFRAYYLEADNMKGDTPDNLIGLFGRRCVSFKIGTNRFLGTPVGQPRSHLCQWQTR